MIIRNIAAAILMLLAFTGAVAAQEKPYLIGYDETKGIFAGVTFVHYNRGHGTQNRVHGQEWQDLPALSGQQGGRAR